MAPSRPGSGGPPRARAPGSLLVLAVGLLLRLLLGLGGLVHEGLHERLVVRRVPLLVLLGVGLGRRKACLLLGLHQPRLRCALLVALRPECPLVQHPGLSFAMMAEFF